MLYLLVAAVFALLLDRFWGEPARWHPLVGFGRLAERVEKRLNQGDGRLLSGVVGLSLMVLPPLLVALLLQWWLWQLSPWVFVAGAGIVVYLAIARQSLGEHARAVAMPLSSDDLVEARRQLARIVSRDTADLDAVAVSGATVESVLENGSDAVVASLFWFVIAGLPGVVLHRCVNTLDAMWGYRTPQLREFGWAAARCDDVLNFVPARLTAIGYALTGNCTAALRCWWRQARHWSSPNAGPVMAAGAGALCVRLGGEASYHGQLESRPPLGCGRAPAVADIERAVRLLDRTLALWLLVWLLVALWPRG
jgi:adenosylcobinamide-phosphate synthase